MASREASAQRPSRLGLGNFVVLAAGAGARAEVAGLLLESAAASAVLFGTVAAMASMTSTSATSYCSCKRTALALMCLSSGRGSRRKGGEQQEEEEYVESAAVTERLEECIGDLETGSEMVFRSLVQTMVALLNTLRACLVGDLRKDA